MSFIASEELDDPILYFAYKRISMNHEHKETFHSHSGTEILLIHQGKGTMIVNHVSYEIKPGMLCIFQPYQLHHLQLEYPDQQLFERSIVTFEPTMFEPYFAKWPVLHDFYNHINSNKLTAPCIYGGNELDELTSVWQNMRQRMKTLPDPERLEEYSLFLISLFRSLRPIWLQQQEQTSPARTRKFHQVEHILAWIEKHFTLPFRLNDMARDLHLSPFYISHLFKAATGMSLTEYIVTRRTNQAIILLTTTEKPISIIAEEIGITNVSYFCKFFKSRTGITPLQYRKRWSK